MKRHLFYLFVCVCLAVGMALPAGCSMNGQSASAEWEPTPYETVNSLAGVTMAVKEGTASPTGLTVTFKNNSGSQCIYGEYFSLEKKTGEQWYQVPVTTDDPYGFEDIGYNLAPGDAGEWTVNWDWLYGSLKTGEYRIIKDLLIADDAGEYDTYYLAAAFAIP